MKILHTSDWHLGKRLNSESLQDAHEKFLDWFATDLLKEEKPDLIVVAGDIYDRAIPSTESIELFETTLARMQQAKIPVLITAGNHDSRIRLGTNTRFMENVGLHFRTRINQIANPVVISNEDFDLLAYGIPYLEPDVDVGEGEERFKTAPKQHDVLEEAVRRINVDIELRKKSSKKPLRTLIAAHAWVTGSNPKDSLTSDSERNIKLGTIGWAGAGIFDGIDYVAMGHLHGHQVVKHGFATDIRYSGSPIPYSFSEKAHRKQVLVAEITKDGVSPKSFVSRDVPQIRGMQEFRGTIDEFLSDKFSETNDWVKLVATNREHPQNVFETLKRKFPHLLELIPDYINDGKPGEENSRIAIRELTPEEVTKRFVAHVTESDVAADIASAIDECCGSLRKAQSQVTK
jgi:exonuclease SbcD